MSATPLPYGAPQTHGSRNNPAGGGVLVGEPPEPAHGLGQAEVNEQGRLYQAFALLE